MAITSASKVKYTNPIKRTNSVDKAVMAYSQTDNRDIASATVKCTPKAKFVAPNLPFPLSLQLTFEKRRKDLARRW